MTDGQIPGKREDSSLQLVKGATNLTFKYNDSGIRTQKTVNGVTTKYTLNGDKVNP